MRRNFGSLDLAAMDLHADATSSASLEERFSAMDPSADADAGLDGAESSCSDDSMCVGFPLERLSQQSTEAARVLDDTNAMSAPVAIRREQQPEDNLDDMPEMMLPARSMSKGRSDESAHDRSSGLLVATPELPQHASDAHNVEMKALRCLSLKMMLSNLSSPSATPTDPSATAPATKTSYTYPAVLNERAESSLLALRRLSLQSV